MNFQPKKQIEAIDQALFEPVADIQADFTDNQWYCHLARQTVYFSAFSQTQFGENEAAELACNITRLAPHLLSSFKRKNPGAALSSEVLQQIITIEPVADLTAYPDKWSMIGDDIFERNDLPMFRIKVASLKSGPNEDGNMAAIMVLATHSLFEGADAVNLSRSQPVVRAKVTSKPSALSSLAKLYYTTLASVAAPLQLFAAYVFAPKIADIEFKSLVFERSKIRQVAKKFGIRQQSLLFALVTFGLNDGGIGFSKKKISTIYADLSKTSDVQTNDSFFQFRMIDLDLKVLGDFEAYAILVEASLLEVERGDKAATQRFLNAMFGAHRWIQTKFPKIYTPQLFRFTAGYHMTLSMVQPQRMGGALTMGMVEPVYTGTYHPGFNMCVFAPGRKFVTLNFGLRVHLIANVDKIEKLFDEISATVC